MRTVDAGAGVVLDAQVDVLGDAEAEVARLAEVAPQQLILLHLQACLLRGGKGQNELKGNPTSAARAQGMACNPPLDACSESHICTLPLLLVVHMQGLVICKASASPPITSRLL